MLVKVSWARLRAAGSTSYCWGNKVTENEPDNAPPRKAYHGQFRACRRISSPGPVSNARQQFRKTEPAASSQPSCTAVSRRSTCGVILSRASYLAPAVPVLPYSLRDGCAGAPLRGELRLGCRTTACIPSLKHRSRDPGLVGDQSSAASRLVAVCAGNPEESPKRNKGPARPANIPRCSSLSSNGSSSAREAVST